MRPVRPSSRSCRPRASRHPFCSRCPPGCSPIRSTGASLLIWGSIVSAVVAVGLTVVSAANDLTPWLLLLFTFVIGATSALTNPAWQSIQPELVPRNQIASHPGWAV
ncbi:MAG: MFS transporter [Galbitalea sp.]